MGKIGKRISIFFICALLIFGSAKRAEAAAEAGALSILGGSVAAGGIGAAIAAIAPPAIIIVGLALAAQGIYVSISEESEKLGMTKSDYIGTKLAQFALESGRQYSDVCHDIVDGAQVSNDGKISLTQAASTAIYQFMNSIQAKNEIVAPSEITKGFVINGYTVPVVSTNEVLETCIIDGVSNSIKSTSTDDIAIACVHRENINDYVICFFSKSSVTYTMYRNGQFYLNNGTAGTDLNGIRYSIPYYLNNVSESAVPFVGEYEAVLDYVRSLNGNFDVISTTDQEGFISDTTVDTSVYNPPGTDVVVLDPGLDLPGIAHEYGKVGTIAIDNYLESLQRALDGVQDNTIAISNTLTGVLENVAVGTYNPVGAASADQVAEEDLPRVMTPVIDLSLNPSGAAAEKDLQGLAFDLTAIFPFCIPFDIFALIEKFDVQPETPRILVSLPLPGLDETLDLDLDLAPFEAVAVILRSMELIAFIVGLALVTRNLIRG